MATAAALSALPSLADAEEVESPSEPRMREVSVTATRTERAVDDVPATVTTIDSAEMERELVRDIRDLIRYEPGISAPNDPDRFGATGFNIRGLTENRVVIQVDGVRLPDHYRFSIGPFNTVPRNFVDLDSLNRVEILRGPSSSLYGSDALGGVVTYLTKDPAVQGASEVATQGTNDSISPLRTVANPQSSTLKNGLFKLVANPSTDHLFRLTYEQFTNDVSTNVLSLNYATPRTTSISGDDSYRRQRAAFDYKYVDPLGGWLAAVKATFYWQSSNTNESSTETRSRTTTGCSGVTGGVNTCWIPRLLHLRPVDLRRHGDGRVPGHSGQQREPHPVRRRRQLDRHRGAARCEHRQHLARHDLQDTGRRNAARARFSA